MKKLLAAILALVCLFGLTACGKEEILEKPPELRIVADDGTVTASKGTYSWMYNNGFNWTGIESDSIHPLRYKDYVETLTTGDSEVKLDFDVEPDSVSSVECWSDEHWGNTDAESETIGLHVINDTLNVPLNPGGWVYVVKADWERTDYNGDCRYVFHVVCTE